MAESKPKSRVPLPDPAPPHGFVGQAQMGQNKQRDPNAPHTTHTYHKRPQEV